MNKIYEVVRYDTHDYGEYGDDSCGLFSTPEQAKEFVLSRGFAMDEELDRAEIRPSTTNPEVWELWKCTHNSLNADGGTGWSEWYETGVNYAIVETELNPIDEGLTKYRQSIIKGVLNG